MRDRASGALYLSGRLWRGIIPAESTWWCTGEAPQAPHPPLPGAEGRGGGSAPIKTPPGTPQQSLPGVCEIQATPVPGIWTGGSGRSAEKAAPAAQALGPRTQGSRTQVHSRQGPEGAQGLEAGVVLVLAKMNLELHAG